MHAFFFFFSAAIQWIIVSLHGLQSLNVGLETFVYVCMSTTCPYTSFLISSYLFELQYLAASAITILPSGLRQTDNMVVSSKQISITLTGDSELNKLSSCLQKTAECITNCMNLRVGACTCVHFRGGRGGNKAKKKKHIHAFILWGNKCQWAA